MESLSSLLHCKVRDVFIAKRELGIFVHTQERNGLLGGNKQEMQELFDKRSKMEADFMER